MPEVRVARSELVLGSGKGGRSARVEALAGAWLRAGGGHRAVCIETSQAWDAEWLGLIDRCRRQPPGPMALLPRVEEATELAHALGGALSRPDTLIVVDCLSFWLTASLMQSVVPQALAAPHAHALRMIDAVRACAGPLVLVGNHVDPQGAGRAELARLQDTLSQLEQQAALACERVTLMSGGPPLLLKGQP